MSTAVPATTTEQTEITVKESFEDLESEFTDTALEKIVIDSVAVLRLVKDCMDSQPYVSSGTLLGMENGTTLEVTYSYPYPIGESAEEEDGEEPLSETVSRCYREANFDTADVGWYTTTYGDNVFLSLDTLTAQYEMQSRNPKSILLVFDPFSTMLEGAGGSSPLAFHAYRLSPEFMSFYETGNFTVENLQTFKVSYKHIFEEIPIYLRPAFPSAIGSLLQRAEADPELRSDRTLLDSTISPLIERSVESLVKKFDLLEAQQRAFTTYQRNIALHLRRLSRGVDSAMAPTQPAQLDTLLLTSQMTSFCDQVISSASDTTAKLYFVNDILKEKEKEK